MRKPRQGRNSRRAFAVALVLAGLLPACHKKVKVDFERPPAVATTQPPPEEETPPEQPEPEVEPPVERPDSEPQPPEEPAPQPKPSPAGKPAPQPPPVPEPSELRLRSPRRDAETIRLKLDRAEAILASLENRSLSAEQREQAAAARAFVSQARKALEEDDLQRASVLVDKALILAEDLRTSGG